MKKQWVLSQNEFDRLLEWLDPERDRAGEKYESIRYALIELFDSWKCCDPEDLADETINRVAVRVESIAVNYSGDPSRYFYGVAKNVRHEYLRKKPPAPILGDVTVIAAEPSDERERLYACLDRCLDKLPTSDKEVILMYYQGDKKSKIEARKHLGTQMSVTGNALRVRAYRIRWGLERCVTRCVQANEEGNKSN